MKNYIKAIMVMLCIGAVAGGIYWYVRPVEQLSERDIQDIHNLFKKDWYLLSARDYDYKHVDDTIRTGSPNEYEADYKGKMKFKVMREGDKFVGFVSYYMKNFQHGIILYLAVEPEFRSKGYGEKLLKYAVQQMFDQGACRVTLVARIDNTRGRAFYLRSGFKEMAEDRGFVGYRIDKPGCPT
ncbi:MAG TPA: GNAT family N-acetyltransferase [Candidatus Babeliales bacterium]|nr:GNAT family N-acetyltransferase [Candidatus Babeliales bacterium]